MGRKKQYSAHLKLKQKQRKKVRHRLDKKSDDYVMKSSAAEEVKQPAVSAVASEKALSIGKQKHQFKAKQNKQIQERIRELKAQRKTLKKGSDKGGTEQVKLKKEIQHLQAQLSKKNKKLGGTEAEPVEESLMEAMD